LSGAEHSLALLAPLRCSLAPSPSLFGWGKPPFPHAPRRGHGRRTTRSVVGFLVGALLGAEHSLALLALLRCSLAPSPSLDGWGMPPFPHAPRRGHGRRTTRSVVGFLVGALLGAEHSLALLLVLPGPFRRGTLACAPRFA